MRRAFYRQDFYFYGTFRALQSHTKTIPFFLERGEEGGARLIPEITQIVEAFGNTVGGEKNGRRFSTIRSEGVVGKGGKIAPRQRSVTASRSRPRYEVFHSAPAHPTIYRPAVLQEVRGRLKGVTIDECVRAFIKCT